MLSLGLISEERTCVVGTWGVSVAGVWRGVGWAVWSGAHREGEERQEDLKECRVQTFPLPIAS